MSPDTRLTHGQRLRCNHPQYADQTVTVFLGAGHPVLETGDGLAWECFPDGHVVTGTLFPDWPLTLRDFEEMR